MLDNVWVDFGEKNILDDTTNGFINSGIIQLRNPKLINKNNTVLSNDLFWVKATINSGLFKMGKVKVIYENGVRCNLG